MNPYDRIMPLAGRILISVIFLFSGFGKLTSWHASAALLAAKGFPIAVAILAGAVIVEILGALCLIFGFQTRIASLIMFLYLIPTTLLFHNFWAYQGAMRGSEQIHFLKNLAILGGLLMVAAYGPGTLAIESKSSKGAPVASPNARAGASS